MKKIFSLVLSVLMISYCLLLGGCDSKATHIFAKIIGQSCEWHEYPDLYDYETKRIFYNGNYYSSNTYEKKGIELKEDEELVVVGRQINLYGMCMPIYKIVNDTDTNVLSWRGFPEKLYFKEGIDLPNNILDCEYSKIVLESDNNKKVVVESENFLFPITIDELIKGEDRKIEISWENYVAYIKFDIEGYPYLTSSGTKLYIYNDTIYFCGETGIEERFYPIKDEYQQAFKDAINELNS